MKKALLGKMRMRIQIIKISYNPFSPKSNAFRRFQIMSFILSVIAFQQTYSLTLEVIFLSVKKNYPKLNTE